MTETHNTLAQLAGPSLKAIEKMGFEELSPIQEQSIPHLMEGKDLIGQAQTGTGKTAAFCLPLLEKIDLDDKSLQAMILCPTRELSVQVAEELGRLGQYYKKLTVLPVYGGAPIDRQIRALRNQVQVVVGTPGRVLDHMRRKTLKLDKISYFVLDEADEMFAMGFRDDMATVIEALPEDVQKVFFSATMAEPIRRFASKYLKSPVMVQMVHKELTVPKVEQAYFELKEYMKTEILTRLIDIHNPKLGIVFCNTKKKVDELTADLQAKGYSADALHGDLKQQQRDSVMHKFKKGTVDLLIATDVAARGLDVDDVDLVINYDMPQDEEYYVHRIGRTARAGREGIAFSFIAGKDIYKLRDIQRFTKTRIQKRELPTLADIKQSYREKLVARVRGILSEEDLNEPLVDLLIAENHNSYDIACAFLRLYLKTQQARKHEELDAVDNPNYKERFQDRGQERGQDRGSRGPSGKPMQPGRFARLHLNIGKDQKISQRHIVGAITDKSGVKASSIGKIEIFPNASFVEIQDRDVNRVLKAMYGQKIKGIPARLEKAKPKRRA